MIHWLHIQADHYRPEDDKKGVLCGTPSNETVCVCVVVITEVKWVVNQLIMFQGAFQILPGAHALWCLFLSHIEKNNIEHREPLVLYG